MAWSGADAASPSSLISHPGVAKVAHPLSLYPEPDRGVVLAVRNFGTIDSVSPKGGLAADCRRAPLGESIGGVDRQSDLPCGPVGGVGGRARESRSEPRRGSDAQSPTTGRSTESSVHARKFPIGRNLVNRAICRLDLVHSPKSQRSCTKFSLPESRHGQSSGTDWRTDFRPATKSVPIILKVP
ncbi:hypothetical protein An02g02560 [Aspergillus niger]|uniref:Uncharacterized protein n=2 Tax=Aspergillus niger TaxID=5061 RepID=A2QC77_ASPNC|nr:hypothetical protein An02g02560 [Aspergillus niger]CAK37537.1 hypothetical protein An02g02560 [Aspergillus niger]